MDSAKAAREEREREIEKIKQEMLRGPPRVVSSLPKTHSSSSSSSSSSASDDESSSSSSSSESEDEKEEGEDLPALPFHGTITLSGFHSKAVVRLAVDKNATRLVTGSLDGTVLCWDLARLSPALKPFRALASQSALTGGSIDQSVTSITFNCSSSLFAVARADPQIRIYNRDGTNGASGNGEAKATTTRGDAYIRDMSKTKGHVGGVSGICWHHAKPETMFSAGALDGTVRVWDVEGGPEALMGLEIACTHILRTANRQSGRTSIQAFCKSSQSSRIIAGCSGGSIQMWDARMGGVFSSFPDKQVELGADCEAFVDVQLDDSDRQLALALRGRLEVRDMRKADQSLWMLNAPAIRSVTFQRGLCLLASSKGIHVLDQNNGKELEIFDEVNVASNLAFWQNEKLFRGHTDGSFTVSFSQRAAEESQYGTQSRSQPSGELQGKPQADSTSSYVRLDQAALQGTTSIVTGSDALKLVREGPKRGRFRDEFDR